MARRTRIAQIADDADRLVKRLTGKPLAHHAKSFWEQFIEPELRRLIERKPLGDPRYGLLQVQPGCEERLLRRAYWYQAQEHHPDHGGDPELFKKIKDAYESICKERGIKP